MEDRHTHGPGQSDELHNFLLGPTRVDTHHTTTLPGTLAQSSLKDALLYGKRIPMRQRAVESDFPDEADPTNPSDQCVEFSCLGRRNFWMQTQRDMQPRKAAEDPRRCMVGPRARRHNQGEVVPSIGLASDL